MVTGEEKTRWRCRELIEERNEEERGERRGIEERKIVVERRGEEVNE